MNKLMISLLLASGLLLLDAAPAQAHHGAERTSVSREYGYTQVRRHDAMPRWLKKDRRFRHWYRHTPLRHYRGLRWPDLYEIYRWERRYFLNRYYDNRRYYDDRSHDRRKRRHYDD